MSQVDQTRSRLANHAGSLLLALVMIAMLYPWSRFAERPRRKVIIPILMYHHVGNWGPAKADWAPWVVLPEDFSAQLDWLTAHHYHTITFRELLACEANHIDPPPNSVMLTFDDGWAEHLEIARTQLEPRGMRGVFFIYTGPIAAQDNGSGYLSWNQVEQLEAAGHEVQSHTLSHPRLVDVPPAQLEREMSQSRATLEARVHHPVEAIAYPFGLQDERVRKAAREAGYRMAVRADDDPDAEPPQSLQLPRMKMSYGEGIDRFAARMAALGQK
ncbi:MAG: polysaccharide deacetylase family protein [Planctomycetes bacterium]|nr:polysaccharide deacetylase family protein [Planctomycetota bacterium]